MTKQTPEQITAGYDKPDPWNYQTTPDDIERKRRILETLNHYRPNETTTDKETGVVKSYQRPFDRALDICCGEGWITGDLPAKEIHGYELSDKAASRFPANVKHVKKPEGKYDLVMLTGALYEHYDWEQFIRLINEHASEYILTSNVDIWEVPKAVESIKAMKLTWFKFPYREWNQMLRVFRV